MTTNVLSTHGKVGSVTTTGYDLLDLLTDCVTRNASDLHLTINEPPIFRVHGELWRSEYPPLTKEELLTLVMSFLSDKQIVKFENELELDFSYSTPHAERFRINVHRQRGVIEAAIRRVPLEIPTLADLGVPEVWADMARKQSGLLLITGPSGMGKSTTMASLIDMINSERKCLIVTIEDPVEFLHTNKKAVVKQREVYNDTLSFATALRHALRQDPEVIVVGEMRDLETISTALTAAETGHLVLATLPTSDAAQTISRIIDVFPPFQQQQVRYQLAHCLNGIISQLLLPHKSGSGRVLASEILIATPGIRNLIREQQLQQMLTVIQTGSKYGMNTMDSCLVKLYKQQMISYETLISKICDLETYRLEIKVNR